MIWLLLVGGSVAAGANGQSGLAVVLAILSMVVTFRDERR